jgi:hypothetical protein
MEQTVNDRDSCDAEKISSEELLQRVPSPEDMQGEMRSIAGFVQAFGEDGRAAHALDILSQQYNLLPDVTQDVTRLALSSLFKIGNFCNAGGRIVFVDPPKPQQEKPNGTHGR